MCESSRLRTGVRPLFTTAPFLGCSIHLATVPLSNRNRGYDDPYIVNKDNLTPGA